MNSTYRPTIQQLQARRKALRGLDSLYSAVKGQACGYVPVHRIQHNQVTVDDLPRHLQDQFGRDRIHRLLQVRMALASNDYHTASLFYKSLPGGCGMESFPDLNFHRFEIALSALDELFET